MCIRAQMYDEAREALSGLCHIGSTSERGAELFGNLWQRAMALLVALYVQDEVSAMQQLSSAETRASRLCIEGPDGRSSPPSPPSTSSMTVQTDAQDAVWALSATNRRGTSGASWQAGATGGASWQTALEPLQFLEGIKPSDKLAEVMERGQVGGKVLFYSKSNTK
jgi:hypothetical protein